MAEINGRAAAEIAAGRKVEVDSQGKVFCAVAEMPTTWTAAASDIVGSGIVIPKGSRLVDLPLVSNGAGTASQTLNVGLRDNKTKVAIDATGIVNALAISSAGISSPATGTLLITGQRYILAADAEIYFTFSAHTPTANQPIRVEVGYLAA